MTGPLWLVWQPIAREPIRQTVFTYAGSSDLVDMCWYWSHFYGVSAYNFHLLSGRSPWLPR